MPTLNLADVLRDTFKSHSCHRPNKTTGIRGLVYVRSRQKFHVVHYDGKARYLATGHSEEDAALRLLSFYLGNDPKVDLDNETETWLRSTEEFSVLMDQLALTRSLRK